ncbi:MAG: hypothetical protein HS113_00090 [Verrucomicrobiales bacterium]|nr:hypothetical protein [Verrucomicrobiales bacterium]
MQTDPLQRRVNAFDLPLDRLAHNPHVSEPDKLRAAARAFEAVLLRQILADAQKPVLSSALSPETSAKAIYRDLITSQLADGIARSGQFGLAQSLESAWQHQAAAPSPTSDAVPSLTSRTATPGCGAGFQPAPASRLPLSSSPDAPLTQEIRG